jgi:hypothetical protein
MLRKNRHITVLLLTFNLLVANVGFSINWLYCYCKGNMTISLFEPTDDCEKENKNHAKCCKSITCEKEVQHVKPCCKKFEELKQQAKPCKEKGKKYFKADLKYFFAENEIQKQCCVEDYIYVATPISFTFSSPLDVKKITLSQPTHAPPLRPFGRKMLAFVQNFRC